MMEPFKTKVVSRFLGGLPPLVRPGTPGERKAGVLSLLYYMKDLNFGDVINEDLARWFALETVQYSPATKCEAVFCGSMLGHLLGKKRLRRWLLPWLRPPVKIWGSGFISAPTRKSETLKRRVEVYAVRGYATLERLENLAGRKLTGVAVGDPGLLAGQLVDTGGLQKKYDLGIIPHFIDAGSSLLSKIQVGNSTVIDIQQRPAGFLPRIAECRNIISSAMHGLIAADSLGIPNVRMILSDNIMGGDYKYDDYYSAYGIRHHRRVNLVERDFTDKDLPSIRENYPITRRQVDTICEGLIQAFPYRGVKSGISLFK